jgi:2-desacetyl-2-hydroxyethyl bacteriochlorophyllide A dehydrogenase
MPSEIVFPAPNRAELRDATLPAVGEGEVKVRTNCTLVSTGTEGIAFARRFDEGTHWANYVKYPFHPGYACVGEVDEVGRGVTGLRLGDRVVARATHASHHVLEADRCFPIPDAVTDHDASWFAAAKIAFVGALAADLRLGASVLVIGAGPIGQMSQRWATAAGATDVIVADLVPQRLALATSGGATGVIAGDVDENRGLILGALHGRLPAVVIDSTGNPNAFAAALRTVADRGRVVVLGDTGSPSEQRLTPDVIIRGLTVIGAHDGHTMSDPRWNRDHEIYRLFFHLVGTGRFKLDGLNTHQFTPDACDEAYRLAETARESTMGMLFDWTTHAIAGQTPPVATAGLPTTN